MKNYKMKSNVALVSLNCTIYCLTHQFSEEIVMELNIQYECLRSVSTELSTGKSKHYTCPHEAECSTTVKWITDSLVYKK